MTRDRYFETAQEQFAKGLIDEETFWAIIEQADAFCEEDE